MEHSLAGAEDALIESLTFNLPNSANFITDRRSVSFFPSNGNEFSPQGVKIVRWMCSGTDWLDPSTLRVQYKFNNKGGDPLYLINALAAIPFRRLRCIVSGQVVEDIDFYNLVYNMLHTLMPAERRLNDAVEGFGLSHDPAINAGQLGVDALNFSPFIPGNSSRIVSFPLLCGLMNQNKKLPLKFLQGLQFELEVVNQYLDCVLGQVVLPGTTVPESACIGATAPNRTSTAVSTQWSISEAVIHCDIITLDSQLDNEYTEHIMSGKSLPIAYTSFVHQTQATAGQDRPVISLSRAFTRLETVYCTFFKTPYVWRLDNASASGAADTTILATHIPLREQNYFWHPQHVYNYGASFAKTNFQPQPGNVGDAINVFAQQQGMVYQENIEPEIQLQIGSKLFPEIPIRSSAEAYYQLRKALGCVHPATTKSINISEREYRTTKFIVAFDIQKEHSAFASGMNTRTGDLITIKCLNFEHKDNRGIVWDNTRPDFIHVTLAYSGMMNITDSGVQVLD